MSSIPATAASTPLANVVAGSTQLTSTKPQITATTRRIQDLVAAVAGPDERLDPEVEAMILDLADDFVEDVANFASILAKHRHSNTIDVQDLQLHLEKHWQMRIPGFSLPDALLNAPSYSSGGPSSTLGNATGIHVKSILAPGYGLGEAHRKRMALVQKAKAKEAKRAAASAAGAGGGGEETTANGAVTKASSTAHVSKKRKTRPNDE